MSAQLLNVLSYFMGLALVFQLGFFAGGIYQRHIIANAYGSALQGVENLFTNVFNLFKRGTNAKAQNDRNDATPVIGCDVDFLNNEKEKFIDAIIPKGLHDRARGYMGIATKEDTAGASQQGGKSFSGKTCPEEGDCDRAGTVDY